MADDEDVPPLEDMSDMLEQVKSMKEIHDTPAHKIPHVQTNVTKNADLDKIKRLNDKPHDRKTECQKDEKSSFGGLKKGFLFGGPPKQKVKPRLKPEDDIPFLKPKGKPEEEHRIPEVQEAMMSNFLESNKDSWLTEDLLGKLQKNDKLVKRLADPTFVAAIAEFQSNPQAAMAKYQGNEEMETFLKDFCGIMGDHFTNIADKSPPPAAPAAPAIQSEDDRKMQDILSDPEVKDILNDPRIQKLFEALRSDPDSAQKFLREADPTLQKRLQKLVEVGLLQVQR